MNFNLLPGRISCSVNWPDRAQEDPGRTDHARTALTRGVPAQSSVSYHAVDFLASPPALRAGPGLGDSYTLPIEVLSDGSFCDLREVHTQFPFGIVQGVTCLVPKMESRWRFPPRLPWTLVWPRRNRPSPVGAVALTLTVRRHGAPHGTDSGIVFE